MPQSKCIEADRRGQFGSRLSRGSPARARRSPQPRCSTRAWNKIATGTMRTDGSDGDFCRPPRNFRGSRFYPEVRVRFPLSNARICSCFMSPLPCHISTRPCKHFNSLIALDLQPNICLSSRSLRTCGIHSLGPKPEAFQNESATCKNTAPATHKTGLFERKATLKTLHKRDENQSTRCMGFCANREK